MPRKAKTVENQTTTPSETIEELSVPSVDLRSEITLKQPETKIKPKTETIVNVIQDQVFQELLDKKVDVEYTNIENRPTADTVGMKIDRVIMYLTSFFVPCL